MVTRTVFIAWSFIGNDNDLSFTLMSLMCLHLNLMYLLLLVHMVFVKALGIVPDT